MEELRRTQERERAERYLGVYTVLVLRSVAHEDGALEVTWKAGEGVSEACVSPKCNYLSANGVTFHVRLDPEGATTVRLMA